jgi:hypothetical protein
LVLPAETLHCILVVGGLSLFKKVLIDDVLFECILFVFLVVTVIQFVILFAISEGVAEFQTVGSVGTNIYDASRYHEHNGNDDPHAHSALLSKPRSYLPVLPNNVGWL